MYTSQNRRSGTRQFTVSAMLSALSVLFLCVSCFVPTGSGILMLLSSGFMCAIVCECEIRYAFISFAAVSLLTMILAADKAVPLIYIFFLGWYPIAKLYIERLKKRKIELLIKGAIGFLEGVLWYIISSAFGIPIKWLCIPITTAGVILCDFVFDLMIRVYFEKIKKRIGK